MAKRPNNKGLRIQIHKRKAKYLKRISTGWDGRILYNCRCDRCVIKYKRAIKYRNKIMEESQEFNKPMKDKIKVIIQLDESKIRESMEAMEKVKLIDDAEGRPLNDLSSNGGWFQLGMRWEDYLAKYPTQLHRRLESLRNAIIADGIKCTGQEHAEYGANIPLFEDGTIAVYSWRGWGDLMAAVWSSHDNKDYHYMDFFC